MKLTILLKIFHLGSGAGAADTIANATKQAKKKKKILEKFMF